MWYSFVIPLLLFIRYWMYRAEKYLYFLIDFCYFANFVCLAQIFIFPHNETFFYVNFMFSNGPLLWAIVAWRNRLISFFFSFLFLSFFFFFEPFFLNYFFFLLKKNSLVFHSIDKMTSIFVHVFPGALMFCLRWYLISYFIFIFIFTDSYLIGKGTQLTKMKLIVSLKKFHSPKFFY